MLPKLRSYQERELSVCVSLRSETSSVDEEAVTESNRNSYIVSKE
jgi:hypothetical protein